MSPSNVREVFFMKNIRKTIAILPALTLALGLAACGTSAEELTTTDVSSQQTQETGHSGSADTTVITTDSADKADIEAVVRALDNAGNTLGYVITVNDHEGYGGDIRFSMGIKSDGTLNGISILEISETAGLGMKADPVLTSQLKDIKVDNISFVKGGGGNPSQGTIDAISGATITTTAVTNGVNAGLTAFFEIMKGGAGA